jgi:hypothetical protein
MDEPISLETILCEFPEDYEAWVLQDTASRLYVTIPHSKYPGREPIHFFMRQDNAVDVLAEIGSVNDAIRKRRIIAVKVNLHRALHNIAQDRTPGHADGFVVHGPNEVLAWLSDRR